MSTLINDFADRQIQVRHYLTVLKDAERAAHSGSLSSSEGGRLLILRAGAFLVLYNVIEATTRSAIQAIHDKVSTEIVQFPSLHMGLKAEVLRRFRNSSETAKVLSMADFPPAFVTVALDEEVRLSGNVDAKLIRELSTCYGFSHQSSPQTRGGSDLYTIKRNRNDLAHGLKTFEEVGRDYPTIDLFLLSRRSMLFMKHIAQNVSTYLDEKRYLAASSM